ncbi:hypothetical protein [Piscibacillus halophilus]|uniref:Uncharacterized protein n=1 Tax=Piscibacillus halophilus TaxID=571933 RepID=A0A1H9HV65_9BACI|nr:hypothetical protein [Piscibacillus halophilus]SEQ66210.1 hypothetical protein SAMN05216362_12126 [Piscibacillus halophilus]
MSKILILSIAAFLALTFNFIKAIRIKEAPKTNKLMAWTFYLTGVIGLIAVNMIFY